MSRRHAVLALAAGLLAATAAPAQVAREVVFRVGENAQIDWFAVTDPAVHGTLAVTNASAYYDSAAHLNAAAVDVARNRLVFDNTSVTNTRGYAVNLTGLTLTPGAATAVTVTDLGGWTNGGTNAGYRKADGQVYYRPDGTDTIRRLNFGPTGLITGSTIIGGLNGNGNPNAVDNGDLEFAADGSLWMTGDGAAGSRLWNFDFPGLGLTSEVNLARYYNGIAFNAAGTTLYGYRNDTGQYGTINTASGAFQTVLATNATLFGANGDLSTATLVPVAVPEPASLALVGLALGGGAAVRRRRRTTSEGSR